MCPRADRFRMGHVARGRTIGRPAFLRDCAVELGALLFSTAVQPGARPSTTTDSEIDILIDEPLGTISPNIYGHFAENLGGVIYDGIWVGLDSKIPNIGGIRKTLVEAMREIRAPIVRFPGGCYADSYDWRDGIGPTSKRPRRTNFWAQSLPQSAPRDQRYDPNLFGTREFIAFCRATGSAPYLAANLRSRSAEEFAQWVEYCNSPAGSTTLSEMRATEGDLQPFDVAYWGVGNEAWGCGGSFTPAEYASEFCRYRASIPTYGSALSLIACGPDRDDWAWTRGFFEAIAKRGIAEFQGVSGFALHYYTWNLSRGQTTDFNLGKGDALEFDTVDWYELLRQGDRMDSLIDRHWQIMGETDISHKVKLVVDEWGSWYRPGSSPTPHNLFEQMPTMRDAAFSALTLDTFNRNADKVSMANCAQLINCLNSPFLAHEDRFCVTPVGRVYEMYAAHQGGQAVRTLFSAPDVRYPRDGKEATFWGLKGSASLSGKTLVLTMVNPHVEQPRETLIRLRGARASTGTLTILTSGDVHAHNTFDRPDAVIPVTIDLTLTGRELAVAIPPASVVKLTLSLE